MGLIKKVYGLLFIQLFITLVVTIPAIFIDEIRVTIASSSVIVGIAGILGMILFFALFCIQSLARTFPMNYVLMFTFTACMIYTVAYICAAINDSWLVI
jgi:protein lifeguard